MKYNFNKLRRTLSSTMNKPPLFVLAAALVIIFGAGLMVGESIGELLYNLSR